MRFSLTKIFATIAWLLVGLLFIFSGLIKLNDPVGTAIKLEEYFEVFAEDFGSFFKVFEPLALFLSITLSALEVVLGVALLLRWRRRIVLWSLLVLIIFFTFLTFYSAFFNKVTDCGCFGDAIKLTPWQSFGKDVILLVLIVFLLLTYRLLPRFLPGRIGLTITVIAAALSLFMGIYAWQHLPYIDFRPYKVGKNIQAQMQPSAPFRYKYIMEKDGKTHEFEQYPTDTTYKYKEMVLLNPEAKPRITDYSVWKDDQIYTEETFKGTKLIIVVQNANKANREAFEKINKLVQGVSSINAAKIEAIAITSTDPATFDVFRHEVNLAVPYYFADATVLKTMIRSNPGVLLLRDGTVLGQWHYNDVPTAGELRKLL